MQKNDFSSNYIQTVLDNLEFFWSYYYHSIIDLNLVKLDLILKNGILSKGLIQRNNLPAIYTHLADDSDSKNGSSYVSISKVTDKATQLGFGDSFVLHTLTSVSLLINKNISVSKYGERMTYFRDELFSYGSVYPTRIEGIIYPENLANMRISEVCCLPKDMNCYSEEYINKWIDYMENYFGDQMDRERIMDSFKILEGIINQYSYIANGYLVVGEQKRKYGTDLIDVLSSELEGCWSRKFNIQNPTFIDIINLINRDRLPIYEVGQKTLKKLN